jgi:hypothetical protein
MPYQATRGALAMEHMNAQDYPRSAHGSTPLRPGSQGTLSQRPSQVYLAWLQVAQLCRCN